MDVKSLSGLSKPHDDPPVSIPPPVILQEIRTGKLRQYGDLTIPTGIYKDIRDGVLHISKVGLPDDEHDLTFHGGPDKAIHQYASDHYASWQSLYPNPEVSARFVAGGFGENLVTSGWTERNVCIGDKVRIGRSDGLETGGKHGALLEVSIPRQPCFKLNQKFGIKNFAPKTHERAWTGWYYRVLEEGDVEAGMELSIIERPNKKWTIERIHHYIHRDKENRGVMAELVRCKELGMESKRPFMGRLKTMEEASEERKPETWRKFKLSKRDSETPRVKRITLKLVEPDEKGDDKEIEAGSHIRLKLPNGLLRPYSVVSGTKSHFDLGIAMAEDSRGGSAYLCNEAQIGDIIEVGQAVESVSANGAASNHIIIAGGIGITAFLGIMDVMDKINFNYELHYGIRSENDLPFKEKLERRRKRLHLYTASKGERMDVQRILKDRIWNSQVYVCGPQRMMEAVATAAAEANMPPEEIHYEAFQAMTEGDAFEAEFLVDGEKKLFEVEEKQTLLEVMRQAGLDIPSSCEVGNCGTCKVKVKSGEIEHRGALVEDGEMLSCVSRGKRRICVEVI